MTEIRDNLVVSITKQSGQKQLVEYPTNGTEYASFARELRAANGTSGKEPWPDLYKGFKSPCAIKQCLTFQKRQSIIKEVGS